MDIDQDKSSFEILACLCSPRVVDNLVEFDWSSLPCEHYGNMLRAACRHITAIVGIPASVSFGRINTPVEYAEALSLLFEEGEHFKFLSYYNCESARLVHLDRKARQRSSKSLPCAMLVKGQLVHYSSSPQQRLLSKNSKKLGAKSWKQVLCEDARPELVCLCHHLQLSTSAELSGVASAQRDLFAYLLRDKMLSAHNIWRRNMHFKATGAFEDLSIIPPPRNVCSPQYITIEEWMHNNTLI